MQEVTRFFLELSLDNVEPKENRVVSFLRGSTDGASLVFAYSLITLSRKALVITLTEDNDIAAAAMIGDNRMPVNGYRSPAATGIPAAL